MPITQAVSARNIGFFMIKHRPLPDDIDARMTRLGSVLEKRGEVAFAYLFGGLARGARRPLSDVDIAVYLRGTESGAETKLELIGLLTDTLGSDEVDLVILNRAPVSLVGRILRQRRVLVDKEPRLRHLFESRMSREFFDFSRKEEAILRQRFS
jgi:predicted nucleotidyltransferase